MTDLRELLRTTAAEGSETVDLAEDVVAGRIRRRRTRNRRFAVGGVALAAAAVIAGTTWAVRPGEQPPTAGGPGVADVPPRIVQSDSYSTSGMEAALQATLGVDANGCVRVASGRSTETLVWPRGYTVQGNNESFEILDGSGKVVARSGVLLNIGGGGGVRVRDSWTGLDCLGDGGLWMVGEIDAAR